MTEIEVLEWLLKAKKAGFDYFLVDYYDRIIEVFGFTLFGSFLYRCAGIPGTSAGDIGNLLNPRLPQVEYDYMDAMELCDQGKRVKSLVSGRICLLDSEKLAYIFIPTTNCGCNMVTKAERLGKWVVVG